MVISWGFRSDGVLCGPDGGISYINCRSALSTGIPEGACISWFHNRAIRSAAVAAAAFPLSLYDSCVMLHKSVLGAFQPNILFVLVGLITLRLLWRRFGGGLSGIPGPALAKVTRLWKLHSVWKGDHHHTEIKLHQKHGPLVRIGPRHVSVADPAAIPVIYGLNKGFTKVG